ncbi:hypothetical protein BJ988_005271 [Nocardioides panzhihuensis]|uniref:Uncharacterized protein n=1 Tax=Nocardioides panzhihuensis TaxID=860243 RepID=A0A7Z0DSB4_9ACTN|nr:hypothetical protein [Nocardioides panzhihuensis]
MASAMCAKCTEDEEIRVLSRTAGGRRRLMCCRCGFAWEGGSSGSARGAGLASLFGAATVGAVALVACSVRVTAPV